ncbi:MAG: L,D-transpeptidase family protein [Mariprofundaceae bacterium]|nr:L,D-transpeptidase family protein [Mariprofundaceae bacterium]
MLTPVLQAAELDAISRERALQALQAGTDPAVTSLAHADISLLKATLALQAGEPEQALDVLHSYTNKSKSNDPLIDMLEAEAYRRSALLAVVDAGEYAKQIQGKTQGKMQYLKDANLSQGLREADVRLNAFLDRLGAISGMPLDILQVDKGVYSIFLVDKARSRMFVYARNANGVLVRVADEYIVTGAQLGDKQASGDARTPNGVYRFVKRLQGKSLESRYGPVAFPIDYPNELDVLHHKNGYGIWMHGYAEGVGRRPPRDTKGCFALPNPRLLAMSKYVELGKSWVIVGENFEFGDDEKRQALQASVEQTLEAWRKDWSALDTSSYLKFYDEKFRSGKRDLAAWKRYKQRVNANKSFVHVGISNLTLIRDSNRWAEGEVVVAEFNQDYRSNNYQDSSRKRLYLARLDAQSPWRILIEESVKP